MTSPNVFRPPTSPSLTKQSYLASILATLQKFQYTRSPQVLRSHMKKSRQQLGYQIEQLTRYEYPPQDRIEESTHSYESPAYRKEKELNERLERQYAEELEIAKGNNIRESQIRFNDKCQEMDATLFTLTKQLDRLMEENKNMSAKLEKQRFYRQWQVMYKQYEGAKSLNSRLKAELEKKKNQIQNLSRK